MLSHTPAKGKAALFHESGSVKGLTHSRDSKFSKMASCHLLNLVQLAVETRDTP